MKRCLNFCIIKNIILYILIKIVIYDYITGIYSNFTI